MYARLQVLGFVLPIFCELTEPISVDVGDLLPDWTRRKLWE